MPVNYFRENRKKVQKVFVDENFIIPLTKDDTPFVIEEKNVSAKLKKLIINNIPATDTIRPISYVLSAELEKKPFSNPPSCKTVEKIFLIFCCKKLYVILVEMKSLLKLDGAEGLTDGISRKIRDSISRILLLFPTYNFDDSTHNDYPIEFFSLIAYNRENITQTLPQVQSVQNEDLVKIFTNAKTDNSMMVKESLGGDYRVKVHFLKNTSDNSEFTVSLTDIFCGDTEIQSAIQSDKTLPDIRF